MVTAIKRFRFSVFYYYARFRLTGQSSVTQKVNLRKLDYNDCYDFVLNGFAFGITI